MSWLQKLPEKITLKDGRSLARLSDVHEFISELPNGAQNGHWPSVVALLEAAAKDSSHANLRKVHEQLCRALAFDRRI
jgi:hypothetical protein